MKMSDSNAVVHMENLFIEYPSILRRHGLAWLPKKNAKLSFKHILTAIRPEVVRTRLESDINLAYRELKNDLMAFIKHAVKLAEASQTLDAGSRFEMNGARPHGRHELKNKSKGSSSTGDGARRFPICLFAPHKSKGIRHLVKDCRACSEDEKKVLLQRWAVERAKDGPAENTRGNHNCPKGTPDANDGNRKVIRRLLNVSDKGDYQSSCTISLVDHKAQQDIIGRFDDGSDESIISGKIANRCSARGSEGSPASTLPNWLSLSKRERKPRASASRAHGRARALSYTFPPVNWRCAT
eukprot:gb/GEZJ01001384.1/.p2 GENE.gb/GEZJ01001384.1/~~gb/GEZJ01001384.1/.p2  ORF type:complete len:297 (-),score=23.80 gb/GEZJ01001384.1/:4742-5632(-)